MAFDTQPPYAEKLAHHEAEEDWCVRSEAGDWPTVPATSNDDQPYLPTRARTPPVSPEKRHQYVLPPNTAGHTTTVRRRRLLPKPLATAPNPDSHPSVPITVTPLSQVHHHQYPWRRTPYPGDSPFPSCSWKNAMPHTDSILAQYTVLLPVPYRMQSDGPASKKNYDRRS